MTDEEKEERFASWFKEFSSGGFSIRLQEVAPLGLVLTGDYHCMNEHGFYDGYANFKVAFPFKDFRKFRLTFSDDFSRGRDRKYQLREYLENEVLESLTGLFEPEKRKENAWVQTWHRTHPLA